MIWLGKTLEQTLDLQELEGKASTHLGNLIDQRDELNERKLHIKKRLEVLKQIHEGERIKPSFFQEMRIHFKKEDIFVLVEDDETKMETRTPEGTKRITTYFYIDPWKNRGNTKENITRKRRQFVAKIEQKVSETKRKIGELPLTIDKFRKVIKLLLKNEPLGIDGIPAEFYKTFNFAQERLFETVEKLTKEKTLTETLSTSIVKLPFKNRDRRQIGNN